MLGSPVSHATKFYLQLKRIAQQANHRQLLCIKGSEQWCIEQAITIINRRASGLQMVR